MPLSIIKLKRKRNFKIEGMGKLYGLGSLK
jgi:hypothetical protein